MPSNIADARGTIYERIRESYSTSHVKQVNLESPQEQKLLLHSFEEPWDFKRAICFSRYLNQVSPECKVQVHSIPFKWDLK